MNFSRPKDFPSVPEDVTPRLVYLAVAKLPALACVERTHVPRNFEPEPRRWIS